MTRGYPYRTLLVVLLAALIFVPVSLRAQTASQSPYTGFTAGTSCTPNGALSYNGNSFVECVSGVWAVQPVAIGTQTASCTSTIAGEVQWTGTALQLCTGSAWSSIATGATVPAGGSNTQVQYNSSGSLAGSSNLVWTNATASLQIGTTASASLGVGTASPQSMIEAYDGEVQIGSSGAACSSANAGAIRYSSAKLSFCNGTAWSSIANCNTTPIVLTSGSSWINVTNCTNFRIEVIGGGGSGGVEANGGSFARGATGGGGGQYCKLTTTLTNGSTYGYTIGSGGAGVSATNNSGTAGNPGGNTWFCNSTSNCSSATGSAVIAAAIGGGGGQSSTTSNATLSGGTGGTGGTGTCNNGGSGGGISGTWSGSEATGGGGAGGASGAGNSGGSLSSPGSSANASSGGSGDAGSGGSGSAGATSGTSTSSGGTGTEAVPAGGGSGGIAENSGSSTISSGAGGGYGGGSGGTAHTPNETDTTGAGQQGVIVITPLSMHEHTNDLMRAA